MRAVSDWLLAWLRRRSPRTVLAVTWALLCLYGYPGILPPSSLDALEQARASGPITHASPALVLLWRAVEHVITGGSGMLALQHSLALLGVYGIARSRLAASAAAWVTLATLACPPVLAAMAVVSAPSAAAAFALFGVAGLLSTRGWHQAVGLAATAVASALSWQLAPACLPLYLILLRPAGTSGPARYPLALVAWLAAVGLGLGAGWQLAPAPSDGADHAGLAEAADAGPPDAGPPDAGPVDAGPVDAGPPPDAGPYDVGYDLAPDPVSADDNRAAGAAEPTPARSERLAWLLPSADTAVPARHRAPIRTTALEIRNRWSVAQRGASAMFETLARFTPLFLPLTYLVLGLVLMLRRGPRDRMILALTASGALQALLAVLVAGERTLPLHWAVVTNVLALALALAQRRWPAQLRPGEPALSPSFTVAGLARHLVTSPPAILATGWLLFMLYAYPGYMSFDSVFQLREARSGVFSDGHPPLMALMWRLIDFVLTGPLGMLLLQSWVFLLGASGLARRFVSARAAAVLAVLLLWSPSVSTVLAVIWKDSQMCGFLLLGTHLLLAPRRRTRIAGLALLALATAMRHNALSITPPIIFLLFVWNPATAGWRRYAISTLAWVAVTLSARVVSTAIAERHIYLWHDSMALFDMTGTLNHLPPLGDDELRRRLTGVPLKARANLQEAARIQRPKEYFVSLWKASETLFAKPTTAAQRAAVAEAWRAIVLANPTAFLKYRLQASREVLHLRRFRTFPIYLWFTDVGTPDKAVARIQHSASPSAVQRWLQDRMTQICTSWVIRIYLYCVLALAILPMCLRDRFLLALVASGLTGELALLLSTPSPDIRYSMWLVLSSLFASALLVARRAGAKAAIPAEPPR